MIRTKVLFLPLALCGLLVAQNHGWHFRKDDPHTKGHMLAIDAGSFEATKDPGVLVLHNMKARIYQANSETFKEVKSENAIVNLTTHTLTYGPGLAREIKL